MLAAVSGMKFDLLRSWELSANHLICRRYEGEAGSWASSRDCPWLAPLSERGSILYGWRLGDLNTWRLLRYRAACWGIWKFWPIVHECHCDLSIPLQVFPLAYHSISSADERTHAQHGSALNSCTACVCRFAHTRRGARDVHICG